jgi:hypothetical protein
MRTDDVEAMTSFFRDVIGLEAAGEGETVTFQRLPRIAAISSSCTRGSTGTRG